MAVNIPITITVIDPRAWADLRVPKRVAKRGAKSTLRGVAREWHSRFIGKKFKRRAYQWYPGAGYDESPLKPAGGRPLVETGSLEAKMLAPMSDAELSGTSTRITWRRGFGRPAGLSNEALEKQAWILHETEGVAIERAMSRVFGHAGYSAKSKAMFQRRIEAVASSERRHLLAFAEKAMRRAILSDAGLSTAARKRVIRGA